MLSPEEIIVISSHELITDSEGDDSEGEMMDIRPRETRESIIFCFFALLSVTTLLFLVSKLKGDWTATLTQGAL